MKRKYCYLYLTCTDSEKEHIATTLLEKRLVACAKFVPVDAMFWWEGKITRGSEILIIFETAKDLYADIEKAVAEIHSYETFVLTEVPMENVNTKAATWLEENLKEAVWTKTKSYEA